MENEFKKELIKVENVCVNIKGQNILSDINLTIMKGETMAIVGRSGSGKTTLLKCLIGLVRPQNGNIYIDGMDITTLDENSLMRFRKKSGVLFQSGALFQSMTVGDNVALPLREHTKLSEEVIKIVVKLKLGLVGLSGCEDMMPSELSGGMKKRAALARAIAMDPEILFFDEPNAQLDPIMSAGIDNLTLKLKSAFRMTIIVVTHVLSSAFKIADRITVLSGGKIVICGKPDEISSSEISEVKQLLEGRPDKELQSSDDYLNSLTDRG